MYSVICILVTVRCALLSVFCILIFCVIISPYSSTMSAKPKTPDKFSRYVDPTGEFSNRELKLSVFYLKHKLLLQKIGKNVLIVWCVVSVGYSFGYWVYYFSFGYFEDQKIAAA